MNTDPSMRMLEMFSERRFWIERGPSTPEWKLVSRLADMDPDWAGAISAESNKSKAISIAGEIFILASETLKPMEPTC